MPTEKQSKVSMVIPCYNKQQYIDETLGSVCGQTWNCIEVILVDDGSTDATPQKIAVWVPRLEERGYEVLVITQENAGVAAAFKAGLERVSGDYLCEVEADDVLLPGYAGEMATFLDEHAEYDWVGCNILYQAPNGDAWRANDYLLDGDPLVEEYLLARSRTNIFQYLVRKRYFDRCEVLRYFPGGRSVSPEPFFFLPLAQAGGRLKRLREPLYQYRMDAVGLTTSFDSTEKMRNFVRTFCDHMRSVVRELPLSDAEEGRLLSICAYREVEYELFEAYGIKRPDTLQRLRAALAVFSPEVAKIPLERIEDDLSAFQAMAFRLMTGKPAIKVDAAQYDRIIGYGVLGQKGREYLPSMAKGPLRPTILWDAAAQEGDALCGMAVVRPVMEGLAPGDLVLVFPVAPDVLDAVLPWIQNAGAKALYGQELAEYVAFYCIFDRL